MATSTDCKPVGSSLQTTRACSPFDPEAGEGPDAIIIDPLARVVRRNRYGLRSASTTMKGAVREDDPKMSTVGLLPSAIIYLLSSQGDKNGYHNGARSNNQPLK